MRLTSLTIDDDEIADKAAEYANQDPAEQTAEDREIAAGYAAAARGRKIIRLSEAIAAGGWFDDTGLPRLAVVRADAHICKVEWEYGRALIFADELHRENRGALVGKYTVRVPVAEPPEAAKPYWKAGQTIVPLVPPRHRPHWPRLRSFHILWEVERWEKIVPRDPALIRHVGGDLWAVYAEWDLTDLERAVLAARA